MITTESSKYVTSLSKKFKINKLKIFKIII